MRQKVSIVKLQDCDFQGAVLRAVESAGGFSSLIKSDSRVVIKPNLARREVSGSGAITDARVTEAVTKLVLDLNPASVQLPSGPMARPRGWWTRSSRPPSACPAGRSAVW